MKAALNVLRDDCAAVACSLEGCLVTVAGKTAVDAEDEDDDDACDAFVVWLMIAQALSVCQASQASSVLSVCFARSNLAAVFVSRRPPPTIVMLATLTRT